MRSMSGFTRLFTANTMPWLKYMKNKLKIYQEQYHQFLSIYHEKFFSTKLNFAKVHRNIEYEPIETYSEDFISNCNGFLKALFST